MIQYKLTLEKFSINVLERKGEKGTIIFIHGNSMSSKIWQKQFDSEELAEYRLLALDLPGHGESSFSTDPDTDYNVLGYTQVLKEFIDKTKAENIVLVGHSLGGHVAMETLPLIKNCKGCVILASSLINSTAQLPETFLPNPDISCFFSADYTEEDVQKFANAVNGTSNPALPEFVKEDFRKTDKNCRAYLAKSVGENKISDELGILQSIEIPILLTVGEEDKLISRAYFKSAPVKKWGDKVYEIKNAGHSAQFENSDEFDTIIGTFCESILD